MRPSKRLFCLQPKGGNWKCNGKRGGRCEVYCQSRETGLPLWPALLHTFWEDLGRGTQPCDQDTITKAGKSWLLAGDAPWSRSYWSGTKDPCEESLPGDRKMWVCNNGMVEFQVNEQVWREEEANIYLCMACLQQDIAIPAHWMSPSGSVSLNTGAEARALDSRWVFFPPQYSSYVLHYKCLSLNVLLAFICPQLKPMAPLMG